MKPSFDSPASVLAPSQNPNDYPKYPTIEELKSGHPVPSYHSIHLSTASHIPTQYSIPSRTRRYIEFEWYPHLYPNGDIGELNVRFYYIHVGLYTV